MTIDDPIQMLREAFDAIEPSAAQRARWSARMAHRREVHLSPREPIPWRLIASLSAAACIMLALTGAFAATAPAASGGSAAVAANPIDPALAMLDEPSLQSPDAQPMMEMHVPATGLDLGGLRMNLRRISEVVVDSMFISDEAARGT